MLGTRATSIILGIALPSPMFGSDSICRPSVWVWQMALDPTLRLDSMLGPSTIWV